MNKLNWYKDIEAEAKEILTADEIKIELYNIMQMFKTMMTRYHDDEESLREDNFYTLKLWYKTDFITMYDLEDILTQWIADKIDIALINKAKKQKPKKGTLKVNFDSLSGWIGFCNKAIMNVEIHTYSENYTYEEYLRKFVKIEFFTNNLLLVKNNERYAIYKNDEDCTLEIHAYEAIMDYIGFSSCTEEYARVPIGKQISRVKCGGLPYVEYIKGITLIEESREDDINNQNQISILDLETKTAYELHKNYNKLVEPIKRVIADIGLKTSKQVADTLILLYRKISLIGEEVSRQAKLDTVNKIIGYER